MVNAAVLRRSLLENGYQELAVAGEHVQALASLPPLHKDPFDRILIAQVIQESVHLLMTDAQVVQYQMLGLTVVDNNTPSGALILHTPEQVATPRGNYPANTHINAAVIRV